MLPTVSGGEWSSQVEWGPGWFSAWGTAGVRGALTSPLRISQWGQSQRFHLPQWHQGEFFMTQQYFLWCVSGKLWCHSADKCQHVCPPPFLLIMLTVSQTILPVKLCIFPLPSGSDSDQPGFAHVRGVYSTVGSVMYWTLLPKNLWEPLHFYCCWNGLPFAFNLLEPFDISNHARAQDALNVCPASLSKSECSAL